MTIASALDALNTDIQNARTAITNKGGTVTANGGSSQLATDIATIPTGGIGIPREVKNGVYQVPTENFTFSLPHDATSVGTNALMHALPNCAGLTSVDLSSLTRVNASGLYQAFYNCPNLTGLLDLSSLTSVGTNGLYAAFQTCAGLTSVDLSSLTFVSGSGLYYAFFRCTGLTSVDLSSLTTVGNEGLFRAFYGCSGLTGLLDLSSLTTVGSSGMEDGFEVCSGLTSVDLSSLTTVGDGGIRTCFASCLLLESVDLSSLTTVGNEGLKWTFYECQKLKDVYFNSLNTSSFGSYKNQFQYMMQNTGTSVVHTLHFPSNMESTISTLTGYPLFDGTSGYVVCAFDLPATS